MASGVRNFNCAVPDKTSALAPNPRARFRLGGSASFRALNPMVATRQADGRAGGVFREGPGRRSPPREG
eukprot:3476885-Alexandrium_andersonii.AAC.1